MSNPTIIRLSDATFVKTNSDVYHQFDDSNADGYSELGGVKRQQKKAAKQAARIERKTANVQARTAKAQAKTELKTARKVGRVEARAAKKDVRVASKIQRKDAKVGARLGRRVQRQELRRSDVGTGQSLGMPQEELYETPSTQQELMEMNAEERFDLPQTPVDSYQEEPIGQEQLQEGQYDDGTVYMDELPEQPEEDYGYESEYEDESEDPESEYFSGFADEFDEEHYNVTGKRAGKKMKKGFQKKKFQFKKSKKVTPTVIARGAIKNTSCGHNRIDLGHSSFGGGSNPLVTSLITLAAVGFAGFLVYKYASK